MIVPLCLKKRTTQFLLPPVDPSWFNQKGKEWGVFSMSDEALKAFEEKMLEQYTKTLTTVSPAFPIKVFALVDRVIGVAAK